MPVLLCVCIKSIPVQFRKTPLNPKIKNPPKGWYRGHVGSHRFRGIDNNNKIVILIISNNNSGRLPVGE